MTIKAFKFKLQDRVRNPSRYPDKVFVIKQLHYYEDIVHKVWICLCEDIHNSGQIEPFDERELKFHLGIME